MQIDLNLLQEQLQTFQKENAVYLPKGVLQTDISNLQFLASEPWRTGGLSGGNCWGGEAEDDIIEAEEENDITALNKFLEEFYPEISSLTYSNFLDKIACVEYSEDEYYGNYTNYSFNYITLDSIISIFENINNNNDSENNNKRIYKCR